MDISEQDIWDYEPDVLNQLLIDHTMSAKAREEANDPTKVVNIFWATNDYDEQREGEAKNGYRYDDQIMPDKIIGQNGRVIMPRVLKDKQLQIDRTKDKAHGLDEKRCSIMRLSMRMVHILGFPQKKRLSSLKEISKERGKSMC